EQAFPRCSAHGGVLGLSVSTPRRAHEASMSGTASLPRIVAPLVTALLLSTVGGAAPARAAETDPYYAWLHPPRDSTAALNRTLNRLLDGALDDVNRSWRWQELSCADVTAEMALPLVRTGMWFFVGAMDGN